jgi:hypothetical protein
LGQILVVVSDLLESLSIVPALFKPSLALCLLILLHLLELKLISSLYLTELPIPDLFNALGIELVLGDCSLVHLVLQLFELMRALFVISLLLPQLPRLLEKGLAEALR